MDSHIQRILELAGNKNRYQIMMVFLIFILWLNCTMLNFSLPFLENTPSVSYFNKDANETVVESMSYEICEWEKSNYTIVQTFGYSWVIDLDIICEKFKVSFLGTLTSLGLLVGAILFSFVNKALGQRLTFFLSIGVFALFVLLSIFVNYYEFYCVTCFIASAMCNIIEYSTIVFNTEITDPNKRTISNAIINSGLGFGGIFYILMYYSIGNWKYVFVICISISVVLGILMFFFFLDSPKDVIDKKDLGKFLKMMRFIAKCNGRLEIFNKEIIKDEYQLIIKALQGEIDLNVNMETEMNRIMTSTPKTEFNDNIQVPDNVNSPPSKEQFCDKEKNGKELVDKENNNKGDSLVHNSNTKEHKIAHNGIHREQTNVEKSPKVELNNVNTGNNDNDNGNNKNLKKAVSHSPFVLLKYASVRYSFILLCFLWFCTSALYSGLTIGIKSLPGSIYVNGIILYCAEIPAYYLSGFLMNTKLGRKKSLMLSTGGFSLLCILLVVLFYYDTASVVLYIITRFFVMSSFCIYYTFCLETYPVSVAQMAYGINGSFNSLGGAVVPFIIEYIDRRVLYGIYAGLGVCCTLLMILLKETKGEKRLDEIKELTLEKKAKELDNIPVVVV